MAKIAFLAAVACSGLWTHGYYLDPKVVSMELHSEGGIQLLHDVKEAALSTKSKTCLFSLPIWTTKSCKIAMGIIRHRSSSGSETTWIFRLSYGEYFFIGFIGVIKKNKISRSG